MQCSNSENSHFLRLRVLKTFSFFGNIEILALQVKNFFHLFYRQAIKDLFDHLFERFVNGLWLHKIVFCFFVLAFHKIHPLLKQMKYFP